MAETAATRSAALALVDERAVMRQGYRVLDEKRMLLATEMLRRLALHRTLEDRLGEAMMAAQSRLKKALFRHGLDGLLAYPGPGPAPQAPRWTPSRFLGLPVWSATPAAPSVQGPEVALDASPEARACREAFMALLPLLAELAASTGNLERLGAEFQRTERRARALENVLLPEIEASLKLIDEHLEVADQEEAIRVRVAALRRQGG